MAKVDRHTIEQLQSRSPANYREIHVFCNERFTDIYCQGLIS